MPNTREKLIELLYEAEEQADKRCDGYENCDKCPANNKNVACYGWLKADWLISNGVTVQQWIPVTEMLPEENGYYLCNVCFSSNAECKSYRRMILYFEDNVWIDMPNCFKTRKPTHWMPLPQPPEGE